MRYSALTLWVLYLGRKPSVLFTPLVFLFGLAFLLIPGHAFLLQLRLLALGETTDATVTGKQLAGRGIAPVVAAPLFAHGGKRGPSWRVQITFTDEAGNARNAEVRPGRTAGDALTVGDHVRIRYLPDDPTRVVLASEWSGLLTMMPFMAVGFLITVGSVVYAVVCLREIHRHVWLVRKGTAVPGRVVRCETELRGSKSKSRIGMLTYEFAAPATENAPAEVRRETFEMYGSPPKWMAAGGPVVVLIDPDRPERHTPDIFDARRGDRERLFAA